MNAILNNRVHNYKVKSYPCIKKMQELEVGESLTIWAFKDSEAELVKLSPNVLLYREVVDHKWLWFDRATLSTCTIHI